MTRKKGKPEVKLSNLGFDDELARLIQTDPKELAEFHKRVAKGAEELTRHAREEAEDIKAGGRRFKRPFRL